MLKLASVTVRIPKATHQSATHDLQQQHCDQRRLTRWKIYIKWNRRKGNSDMFVSLIPSSNVVVNSLTSGGRNVPSGHVECNSNFDKKNGILLLYTIYCTSYKKNKYRILQFCILSCPQLNVPHWQISWLHSGPPSKISLELAPNRVWTSNIFLFPVPMLN